MDRRPTPEEIRSAAGSTISDVIAPNLKVLFCGINPGLYSGAAGHNFARPGNRFWPALHKAEFTDRLLSPWEEFELLRYGLGITNFVARATAGAVELSIQELVAGRRRLMQKVHAYNPACVAILGIGAYRTAFQKPNAKLGRQPERYSNALVWLLPNPSGLNAHYQLAELVEHFRDLRQAVACL